MTELEKYEAAKSKGYTYNPVTGELKGVYGKVIKTISPTGYIRFIMMFNDRPYSIRGHRLAWYLCYGKLPLNQIDHIDGNRTNNKITNLRDVTQQQNQWNQTKAKGYYWDKQKGKYTAQITLDNKRIYLGAFPTEEEARNAYLKGKSKYHVIVA